MNTLANKIESYKFECEAGPLEKCVDWETLKSSVDLWVVVKRWAGVDSIVCNASGHGGWRFIVYTNKGEAEATANSINRKHFADQSIIIVARLTDTKIPPAPGTMTNERKE